MVSKPRVVGARLATQGAKRALRAASKTSGAKRRAPSPQTETQHALLLGPWLVLILAFFVGQLVHAFFDSAGSWEWLCYVGLACSTGIVGYASWHTTKARTPLSVGHTLGTVSMAGIWLMFAATTGLVHWGSVNLMLFNFPVLTPVQPTFNLWWMFGGAAAIAWNIRQGVSRQKEIEEDTREPNAFEYANLDGVKGDVKPVNQYKSQGIFTLPPGMTIEDVQPRLKSLESAKGWPKGSARMLPAPGTKNPRKVLGVVMMQDPLDKAVPWPGVVVKRGMDLMSLIPTGLDADGDESGLWVVRPEGTKHGLVVGMTGSGKALDVETPVPTSSGWTTMGDIQIGDELFDNDGNPCHVTEVFDVMHNRPCYEVVFSDGETIVADAEHLWWTEDSKVRLSRGLVRRGVNAGGNRRFFGQVRTTSEIASSLTPVGGSARSRHRNHSVPVSKVLQLPDADLPLSPYVLGFWLGDGCSNGGSVTTTDPEILDFIRDAGFVVGPEYLTRGVRTSQYIVYGLVTQIRKTGILPGKKGNKFIPGQYLRSSESQRRELLAGLLDADGTPERGGSVSYTSTVERLAYDVHELAISLGYRATIRKGVAKIDGRVIGDVWDVEFTTSDQVFRLSRKLLLHKERSARHNSEKTAHRYIVDVRVVESRPVRCIAVDSPSHLFLVGRHMVATHNSEGEKPVVLYTARLGAVNIIIDTVKKTQTFGPLAPALHWLVTDESAAKAVLRRISKEVIPGRTNHLASEGLSQWSLKSSLSLVRLHIEEAWDLVDNDEIVAIALAARSAGIQLTLSLQRPSHDMISTTVREQLGTRRCYGLAGRFGTMVLDDEVTDAGADPEQWKDTAPGMHYMQRGGMTIEEMATSRRAYYDFADKPAQSIITFADAAAQVAEHLKPLDPVTAGLFGPLWSNRTTPLDVVRKVGTARSNVTKATGDALKAAQQASAVDPKQQVPGLPEGTTHQMLQFLAQAAGTSTDDIAEAMRVYVENQVDVSHAVNEHPAAQAMDLGGDDEDGDPVHVVESDDYITQEYDPEDGTLTVSTPGLKDAVIDFGENAPDADDIALLRSVDPDADLEQSREGLLDGAPAVLGASDQVKWTREQLDQALFARFAELRTAGRDVVKGADFMGVYAASGGWARTGIYPFLRKLEREQGLVTEDDGVFLIVKG